MKQIKAIFELSDALGNSVQHFGRFRSNISFFLSAKIFLKRQIGRNNTSPTSPSFAKKRSPSEARLCVSSCVKCGGGGGGGAQTPFPSPPKHQSATESGFLCASPRLSDRFFPFNLFQTSRRWHFYIYAGNAGKTWMSPRAFFKWNRGRFKCYHSMYGLCTFVCIKIIQAVTH